MGQPIRLHSPTILKLYLTDCKTDGEAICTNTMGVCFLCDTKLCSERILVSSSITPRHSNASNQEKIVEFIGDEFVVIVTPADHICEKCISLLLHMDKLENYLKLVKNAMLLYI
ncbi:uncharacterized protein LOC107882617 [Acyrthosiphon pisum]|uniref:Uncharacterized protein n=1 Tax=Acyrthosiphon pisum TaxID=7029 RepID=A0A8R2JLJ3_ACYPI|nr:uncharacterized protein LOC107882617 [Acyrthosiphon pisum]